MAKKAKGKSVTGAPKKGPKPPLNPETMFRQAFCFDGTGHLLEPTIGACFMSLGRAGELKVERPAPTETTTATGIVVVESAPPDVFTTSLPLDMIHRIPTLVPLLTIQALATEIYLKCILVLDGERPPTTHKLLDLHRLLKPVRQKRWEELYDANAQPDLAFQATQRHAPKQPMTLLYALTQMNSAFETWRYAHELPGPQNDFLGRPWIAARQLILELQPTYAAYFAAPGKRATSPSR